MAGELARKELEVEALKETLRTCRSRAAQAESGARQMTEQMNLIKTMSEEVAMLEAEEIARLEGELEACTKKLADERKCCVDDKAEYERKLGVLASESEEAKGELLKMKRAHNLAAEKAQRLAAEVESMKGYSQDVANRLHSVQFSGHVRDVLGQAANKAAASKGEGERASAWRDFKRGSDIDWSRLVGRLPTSLDAPTLPVAAAAAANSINSPFVNGYLTGVPSQTFRPINTINSAANTTVPIADSLISLPDPGLRGTRHTDHTSELELLYIQREKELLDKLADTMTKMRVYEDEGKSPTPLNKQKKRRSNRWSSNRDSADPASNLVAAAKVASEVPRSDQGPAREPPSSPPRSLKRTPKPGLHQPTASSLAKNEGQILKKVRNRR